ncbi:hypothetical protein TCAL_14980 [Tigriopus californicus]|uniref:Uncharacterized protein n=1 Tax=Tigriopus californicus TaxID=6832 RepID=A0A553N9C4_TIGCA|nr:hypothetical protein TCAL_14980 [Tigriopus californicus]
MMDLTDEVSSGAVDMAKSNLEKMLTLCAKPVQIPEGVTEEDPRIVELRTIQEKSLRDVINELVRQLLAEIQGKGITEVMDPHKDVLQDMIPPRA